MVLCLFAICILCSGLLAGVYALTKEPIDAAAAAKTNNAIAQVVPEFDSMSEEKSVDVDGTSYNYYEVSKGGEVVAYAIKASAVGFGGPIALMVGVTADGIIYNTSVLSQAETPGLGAKCTEPAFADQFKGFNPAEKKLSVKKDGGDIDAITASTITSRAYANALALAMTVHGALTGTAFDAPTGASSGSWEAEKPCGDTCTDCGKCDK